jgi:flagellar biosynthesis protein FlhG
MEAFISRSLREFSTPESFLKMQNAIQSYRSEKKSGYFSFRNYLQNAVGFNIDFFEELSKKPVRLIMNQTRSRLDEDLGYSIKSVCNKYYDFTIDYCGFVEFDNAVWQAVKNKEAVLIEKPFTPIAGQLLSICKHLTSTNLNANYYRAVV